MPVVVPEAAALTNAPGTEAFQFYIDLRTAVVEHVARPDIADVFPRLVALAESRLNRTLRMRQQITRNALTLLSGRADLPVDFREMIGVYDADGKEFIQQSPQKAAQLNKSYYSVQGDELVSSEIAGTLNIDYYASLPPLSESATTSNWLLQQYPDVYLYAVSFEAAKYVRDADLITITKTLLDDAIGEAQADDRRSRYSRARVRVAGVTP